MQSRIGIQADSPDRFAQYKLKSLERGGEDRDEQAQQGGGPGIHSKDWNCYLKRRWLSDAFVMGNYRISIGVLNALRGIDRRPAIVRISHEERENEVIMILR